jgi:tetratricopeptide (TPR) repeat protein
VLVALTTLADASEQPAHDASEGGLLPSAWSALERAVSWAVASAPPASVPLRAAPPETAPLMPSPLALSPPATSSPAVSRRWPVARVVGVVLAMLAVGAAVWGVRTTRADRSYRAGVDAYRRGAREVARTAFAKAAQQRPGDVRALVYLGRMLREDGEMARARTLLTTAVRRDPTNALAAYAVQEAVMPIQQLGRTCKSWAVFQILLRNAASVDQVKLLTRIAVATPDSAAVTLSFDER